MTLQLAAANMEEYVKGKVLSAVPFSIAVGIIVAVASTVVYPQMLIYAPFIMVGIPALTLISGSYAAFQAAMNGDFRAQRISTRRSRSAVAQPITGLALLKVQMLPYLVGFAVVVGPLAGGIFLCPLYAYLGLVGLIVLTMHVYRSYCYSAGVELAQIDASRYL